MLKSELPSLRRAAWLREPRLQAVLRILNVGGTTRVAGGAVRNALLGVPVADVDLATTLLPSDVMAIAKGVGLGVHPTGVEHGTVTVTYKGAAFEVTTLRRDVETDGRHAVVSFTDEWAEDAARRDFTMNAMYCDAAGKIYDFTEGYLDIQKRKVRFVGVPAQRIQEDYLRILRFFRFHGHFGKATPDAAGLKACVQFKSKLKSLSAERVRQEILKLLSADAPVKTLQVMARVGILKIILPYTDEWRVIGRLPADAVLRLFVLAKHPAVLKEQLRLSNEQARRLEFLSTCPVITPKLIPKERRRMLYTLGAADWRDAVQLSWARSRAARDDVSWLKMLKFASRWPVPKFPVNGSDVLATGEAPGPRVGKLLAELEGHWLAQDFKPTQQQLLARLAKTR